jgi:hypothetical protein
MEPQLNKIEESSDAAEMGAAHGSKPIETEQPEVNKPEEPKNIFSALREAYGRARDGQKRVQPERLQSRTAKSVDRSKGLLILAAAVIVMIFVFLGLFSSSSSVKGHAGNRTKPSLGRPDVPTNGSAEKRGSVTPLLNADMSGQDSNSDQLSADDVKATGRVRVHPQQKTGDTLANIPPMDPALQAYRQAVASNPVPQPSPVVASVPAPATPVVAHNDADALKKSSLVFVASNSTSVAGAVRPASFTAEPALLERRVNDLLPNGSRLVARLQAAVSTAVKAPVVAAIEYNYERDGEIVIPAGAKAFGDLAQSNRNGNVGIHFHTLQLPDGTTEKIDAVSMSLTYGPLKGSVSGGNAVKRILVRSLAGVGTMAAYLVGGPGGIGVSGQLDNSVLLRERIASNAGLAGEQEVEGLAANENIVVSVPGNTRFFLVLLEGSGQTSPARTTPMAARGASQISAGNSALPSAEEIKELIELKSELNQMYQQVAATRTTATTGPPQQQ